MADAEAQPTATEVEIAPPTAGKRRKLLTILGIVVVAIAVIWGLWYFLTQAGRVHTDNAYVGADSAQVTSLVSGAVTTNSLTGSSTFGGSTALEEVVSWFDGDASEELIKRKD
ncbi:MAG: hypothetical protein V4564_12140 [Pseudomonadota bacterium]